MDRNKKKIIIALLGISLLTGTLPSFRATANAQTTVSFQVFYDQLSPFGNWVDYSDYGYCWVPAANSGFRPYGTRGHWLYSDDGWVWVSDYSWGWATFHYGNWFYDNTYGWMWLPGYVWAPAWVTWGEYDGDYCWAPVSPRIDIGISFGTYRPAYNYWNFCPREHIADPNVSHYLVSHSRNTTFVNHITVIDNVARGGGRGAWLRGPAPANVERFTHAPIRPVAIQASSRPGTASLQHGQLSLYRPIVRNYSGGVRPARVQDLHALRPASKTQAQPPATVMSSSPRTAQHPVAQRPLEQHPVTQRPTHSTVMDHRYSPRPVVTPHTMQPAMQHPVDHTVMQQRPIAHPGSSSTFQQQPAAHPRPSPAFQRSSPAFQQRAATAQRSMQPPQHQMQSQQHQSPPPHSQPPRPTGMPVVRNQPPQLPHGDPHERH